MEQQQARDILRSLIARSIKLHKRRRDSPQFNGWKRDTRIAIAKIFGNQTDHIKDFDEIHFTLPYDSLLVREAQRQAAYVKGLRHSAAILQSMIEEVNQYWSNSTPKSKKKPAPPSIIKDQTKVFVVHGRNTKLFDELCSFLTSIGLNPIEWNQAISKTKKGSPSISEILDAAFNEAQAFVVLLTGDDHAKLRREFLTTHDPSYERNLTPQSRPNVLFESGMALGRYPSRTVLVQIGRHRPFSDIAGKHITHLDDTAEKRHELATKLSNSGCKVRTSGTRWFKAGNFS
jgi:predicted nucleotide-binding protein